MVARVPEVVGTPLSRAKCRARASASPWTKLCQIDDNNDDLPSYTFSCLPPSPTAEEGKIPLLRWVGGGSCLPLLTHRKRGKNPPFAVGQRGKLPPPHYWGQ